MADRTLSWAGTYNARDLGGLPTVGGGLTRRGAIVRSDSLESIEARGWEEAEAYGIRTVIDLRNESEIGPDLSPRPASIETVNIPLDVTEARDFWEVWGNGPQFATPLYYAPHLERFPERSAQVLRAIATAPGGVVFHCQGGRDRAGQISLLVLALAGVEPEAIAADYSLSDERLRPLYLSRGEEDEGPKIAAYLRDEHGTTASALIVELLATLDVESTLRAAGLSRQDLDGLRLRLG